MPHKSRFSTPIPIQSLPDYVFSSSTAPLEDRKPAIVDAENPKYHLTHHTYREWSKRLAAGLLKSGFRAGDRLILYSGNTIFFPVVLMGTIAAGGVFTGANPTYVARELAYQMQDSGAKFLITSEASIATALEAVDSIKFPRDNVFVFDSGFATFDGQGRSVSGIAHWSTLLASPQESADFRWECFSTREEMEKNAVLNYSSGTTGLPKGVLISHMNYISNCTQTQYLDALDPGYEEDVKTAVSLSLLPMYHAYGQTYHCVSMVKRGVPIYLMRKFDFVKMLEYVQKYRVTSLTLVPPIAVALTKRPEVKNYDLSSVRSAGCGAAPLGRESTLEFDSAVAKGKYKIRQGWGMTEITCSAIGWDPRVEPVSGSIGEPMTNVEIAIMGEDGQEMPDGQRGELWVRGPNVMKGYWKKPEATKETKTEGGWLKTGDIAYRDQQGLLYIVDRKKELIKVKGNQVAPAELEALLLDHPAVQDVAVVGVTINGEELPRAYIVPQQSQNPSPKDIAAWLAQRVAPHKRLAGGVAITDSIPKNPSGKIMRKQLKDRAKEEVGDGEVRGSRL
ncbi:acetyl-CoA synthetase-like protein [Teratosphaeria nubilosa]|uniref:Acetyl-CoA synthetase-like protein n=1 Tax=Teratosphaeria nubilosa TaxID=161662 RepID=A0A6G1LPC0_9PEZI|nr:acetyl-CoA synthetase-like protein [Teratosphaeria nubilosa]